MLSHFGHVLLFVTQWTVGRQVPLTMGFSRQEYQSGLPCPPPGDLLDPGMEPTSLTSPALSRGFFTTRSTWEALSLLWLPYKRSQTEQLKHRNSFLIIQRLGSPRSMFQRGRFHGAASPPGRVVATILLCAHMTSLNTGRERKTEITRALASPLLWRLIP